MWFMISWLILCIILGFYNYITERHKGHPHSSLVFCLVEGIFQGWLFGCCIAFVYFIILGNPFNIR